MLRKLQDDYFEMSFPYGKECGITLERGTKVEYQTKKYLKKTYYELGLINQEFEKNNQLAQDANQLYKIGELNIEAYKKKLKETQEQSQKLQAQKDKMNRDLNIILEKQGNEDRKNNLMKEGGKEIRRQERKDKEQSKGNDFGLGM